MFFIEREIKRYLFSRYRIAFHFGCILANHIKKLCTRCFIASTSGIEPLSVQDAIGHAKDLVRGVCNIRIVRNNNNAVGLLVRQTR